MNVKVPEMSTSSWLNLHIVLVLSTLDVQRDDGHHDGRNM